MKKNTIYQIFNFDTEMCGSYQLIRPKGFDKQKGIQLNPYQAGKLGYENYVVMYPHYDFDIYPSFDLIRFDKISCLIRLYSLHFGESYILDHQFDYADAIHLISRFGNERFEIAVKLLIKKYGEKPDYYWDDE